MADRPKQSVWRMLPMVALWVALLALIFWVYGPRQQVASGPPAPDAVGWAQDFDAALAEARGRGVPVLANFTAEWCPPCQDMHREVYSQEAVGAAVNDRFVPVRVDMTDPGAAERALAERYGVMGLPTLMVVAPDGRAIASVPGYIDQDALLRWLGGVGQKLEGGPAAS